MKIRALYRLARLRLHRRLCERERRVLQRWSRIPNQPASHFDQATKRKLELR